jgi:hypothetical protein
LRRKTWGYGVYLRIFKKFKYNGYHSWIFDNGDIYDSKHGAPSGKVGTTTDFQHIGIWNKRIKRTEAKKNDGQTKISDHFPLK